MYNTSPVSLDRPTILTEHCFTAITKTQGRPVRVLYDAYMFKNRKVIGNFGGHKTLTFFVKKSKLGKMFIDSERCSERAGI